MNKTLADALGNACFLLSIIFFIVGTILLVTSDTWLGLVKGLILVIILSPAMIVLAALFWDEV